MTFHLHSLHYYSGVEKGVKGVAIRLVNEPEREAARGSPVRHTGEQWKEQYIRGHLSPVYIRVIKLSCDSLVILSHGCDLHESACPSMSNCKYR